MYMSLKGMVWGSMSAMDSSSSSSDASNSSQLCSSSSSSSSNSMGGMNMGGMNMDGMGNTNNSNITSSNCNTSTTTPPDATAAENTNIPNNMSGMSMMDMDPVYTQTMLTTTLIATAISFYLLYYVWKKRSYIPKEIMEDKGHRAVYFGAPLLFSLSCLLSIPITSYPFVNSPSSSFIELVNVTYSLIMPLFHVSIGMFCYQCVLRCFWLRGLLSINQSLLSTVMYAVLVVFTAELLIVSPWSVYAVMSQTIEVNSAYLLIFQAYIEAPEIAVLTLFDTCLCLIVFHFFAKNKVGLKQVAMGVVRSASLGSIKRAMSWKNIQNNNTSNNFLAMPTSPSVDASRPKRTEECLKVIVQSVKRFLLPCLLCSWASMLLALSSSAYVMKDDEQNKYAVLSSVGIVFTAIHLVFFQHFVINLKGMSRLYRASNSFPTSDVVDDKIVSIGVSAFNTSIYDTNLVVPPLPSSNLIAAGGGGGVAVGGSTTTKPMPARRSSFFGQTELAESPDLTSPLIVATGTIPEKIQMASPKSPNQPQSFSNIIEMYHIRD